MTTPSRTTLEHELYDAADEVWPGPVLNGRVTDRHRRAERLRARAAAVREYQRQAAAPGSNPDMIRMLALLTGPDIEAAYELHTHPGGKCLTAPAPCLPYGSVCTSPRECGETGVCQRENRRPTISVSTEPLCPSLCERTRPR